MIERHRSLEIPDQVISPNELEVGKHSVKSRLAIGVELVKASHELAAEDAAEDFHGRRAAALGSLGMLLAPWQCLKVWQR